MILTEKIIDTNTISPPHINIKVALPILQSNRTPKCTSKDSIKFSFFLLETGSEYLIPTSVTEPAICVGLMDRSARQCLTESAKCLTEHWIMWDRVICILFFRFLQKVRFWQQVVTRLQVIVTNVHNNINKMTQVEIQVHTYTYL